MSDDKNSLVLYDELIKHFGAQPDRRDDVHVDCPACGKQAKRGQRHFAFSPRGAKCWVCDYRATLRGLARRVGASADADDSMRQHYEERRREMERERQSRPLPPWRERAVAALSHYAQHPQKYDLWQRYKPLFEQTIDRHKFGAGKLPFSSKNGQGWYMSKNDFLIVPLFERGELVGLRGRNLTSDGPKWLSASGTKYTLWNVENVPMGAVVWITENYVDAAMLMERYPEYHAVAMGGASNWRDEWTEQVAALSPTLVAVCLDNDLAGQASGKTLQRLQAERKAEAKLRGVELPDIEPAGPKIANRLLQAGVTVKLWRWDDEAPAKADLCDLLLKGRI